MAKYIAYTDGSYDMETHYGASAVIILDENEETILYQRGAARFVTSEGKAQFSQEQELGACIRAVRSVPEGSELVIKTDSQYCCKVLSGEWEAHANLGLIDTYHADRKQRHIRVHFVKVKGHSGNRWNEMADELCRMAVNSLIKGGPAVLQTANNCNLTQ